MVVEENLKSKSLYKIFLIILKVLPILLAICAVLNTLLSYIGIDIILLSFIGGISFLPLLFLYISAYVFKFCIYHRIFLDYAVVNNVINIMDFYWGIPATDLAMLSIQMILFFIAIIVALIAHLREKKYAKTNKQTAEKVGR